MKTFAEQFPGVELKGLKYFRGMEGDGFNVTILYQGKKLAFVINEGNGGALDYDFADDEARAHMKAMVELHRKDIPPGKDEDGFDLHDSLNLDILIEDMCNAFDLEKRLRRAMKTKTVFVTPTLKPGEAHVINRPYDPLIVGKIKEKYPEAVILNESWK